MEKTQVYTIEKLGAFGEGVARDNGKTVFIKGALPGERVKAKITLDKKTFSVARLKEVLNPSDDRVLPKCRYFGRCGGCSLQHLSYDGQLKLKQQTVVETLQKIGGIEVGPLQIVASREIFGYRNKLSYPVCGDKIGLYAENSHDIVDIDGCLLQRDWNVPLCSALRRYIADFGNPAGRGIRHIVAREKDTGLCVTVVTYGEAKIEKLFDYLPFDDCVMYRNINDRSDNVILGEKYIRMASRGKAPQFHPASFYQVNDYIADKLYDAVAAACDCENVIDAYCGAGDLTLRLARNAKSVTGVEIVARAVDEAEQKARNRGIQNARFVCGDCKIVLPELFASCRGQTTVVFDPPRKGLEPEIIASLKRLLPDKIIYVSCNPTTLARDLGMLKEDYSVGSVQLFDMFPQTPHVETLVILLKKVR